MDLWVHLVWDSWSFLDLNVCFFSQVREVFSYHVFQFFALSSLLLIMQMLVHAGVLSCFSHDWLCATLWTAAWPAPLSMDSPGKNTGEYPPPGDLPDPGTESEPVSLMSPALAGRFSTTSASWEAPYRYILFLFSTLSLESCCMSAKLQMTDFCFSFNF